jgi:hypothetical protein
VEAGVEGGVAARGAVGVGVAAIGIDFCVL